MSGRASLLPYEAYYDAFRADLERISESEHPDELERLEDDLEEGPSGRVRRSGRSDF
jgi:hypothetical protein